MVLSKQCPDGQPRSPGVPTETQGVCHDLHWLRTSDGPDRPGRPACPGPAGRLRDGRPRRLNCPISRRRRAPRGPFFVHDACCHPFDRGNRIPLTGVLACGPLLQALPELARSLHPSGEDLRTGPIRGVFQDVGERTSRLCRSRATRVFRGEPACVHAGRSEAKRRAEPGVNDSEAQMRHLYRRQRPPRDVAGVFFQS